jgi:hypothetical protein
MVPRTVIIIRVFPSAHLIHELSSFEVFWIKRHRYISIIGQRCAVCYQFIAINSVYRFRALICLSSGGTVYCIQQLCRLAEAASRHNAHNIPIVVYTVPPDDDQISALNM